MIPSVLLFLLFQSPIESMAIGNTFPIDFKDKAFNQAVRLTQIGPRWQAAAGTSKAMEFVRQQFEDTGLDVRVEHFEFETFSIDGLDFTVGNREITVESIGFNPYEQKRSFQGVPLFLEPKISSQDLKRANMAGRIVVTTPEVSFFRLMFRGPELIVYISDADFASLKCSQNSTCALSVKGKLETHTSANIVAERAAKKSSVKEVIISAHWDAYRNSPGADDNGSGMGVLIELARYFSNLPGDIGGTIKFIAFGAEELGIVGSRAYLDAHRDDLQDCVLVFNMDQIGGPKGPAVEMLGGVSGIPEQKGTNQFPARIRNRTFEGLDGRWRILDSGMIEAFKVTNRPQWLVNVIQTSADQLGIQIRPTGNLGADQQVFTQAGIVATSIGFSGNQYHNSKDLPSQIHKENLELTGKLVANVALLALRYKK